MVWQHISQLLREWTAASDRSLTVAARYGFTRARARNLRVPKFELYGTGRCPYTSEMRDWLEFRNCEFVEYDVESDPAALARMQNLAGRQRAVPVLVEDGRVVQIGWQGRSCIVAGPAGK
jgi:mycoredoxin